MSSSKLACAVVGVGYLGRFHAQKYKLIENARLVGVCDTSQDRANQVAGELQVSAFSDVRDLLGKVEAVTIAATTQTHYELAKFFLSHGVHVFVEKPITSTLEQAYEIVELADKKNLRLQVGHIERFNPTFRSLVEQVKQPILVECKRVSAFKSRGSDVSVVHDVMIHDVDLALSLAEGERDYELRVVGDTVICETPDHATVSVEFASGLKVEMRASRLDHLTERSLRVYSAGQGYIHADLATGELTEIKRKAVRELEVKQWSVAKQDALLLETIEFVAAVQEGRSPEVGGRDGIEALKMVERIVDEITCKRNS